MKVQIPLGSYSSLESQIISTSDVINMYYTPRMGSQPGGLVPVHGHEDFSTLTSIIRDVLFNPDDGLLYAVEDTTLYEVNTAGTATSRGTISGTSVYSCSMALNTKSQEIFIIGESGGSAYVFDYDGNNLSTVSDGDFPTPGNKVISFDGYFIVLSSSSAQDGRFYWSDLNDGASWTSTNFATKEGGPDGIVDIISNRRELWLLGSQTTEVWYNTGDATSTFARVQGGLLHIGVAAPNTVAQFDNSIIFPAVDANGSIKVVRIGSEYGYEVVSTPEVSAFLEQELRVGYTDYVVGYSYTFKGHEFYVLKFDINGGSDSGESAALVYDATTKLWHKRQHWDAADDSWQPDHYLGSAFIQELAGAAVPKLVFGSTVGLKKVDIDDTPIAAPGLGNEDSVSTNDDERLFTVVTPTITRSDEKPLRISSLQLDIEEGTADPSDTGSIRQVTVQYSKDGGRNYSGDFTLDIGDTDDIGAGGSFTQYRLIKRKLGVARSWTFKFTIQTLRKFVLRNVYISIPEEANLDRDTIEVM